MRNNVWDPVTVSKVFRSPRLLLLGKDYGTGEEYSYTQYLFHGAQIATLNKI